MDNLFCRTGGGVNETPVDKLLKEIQELWDAMEASKHSKEKEKTAQDKGKQIRDAACVGLKGNLLRK